MGSPASRVNWGGQVSWLGAMEAGIFGLKPPINKGGMIAAAPIGWSECVIPTPQPVHYRPMFGAFGRARESTSLTFAQIGFRNKLNNIVLITSPVASCRNVSKLDMVWMTISQNRSGSELRGRADGELLTRARILAARATVLSVLGRWNAIWLL